MSGTAIPNEGRKKPNPNIKLALEFAPLGVFACVLAFRGIFDATAALMVSATISLGLSRILLKKVTMLAVGTCISILVFGSLTLYFRDPTYIKIKLTIINALFAVILAVSLYIKKPLLKTLLGEAFQLQDEGWRILTGRWIGFFIGVAVLNEIVWRNFSDETWGLFKSVGVIVLTMLFVVSQVTVIMKYQTAPENGNAPEPQ